MSEKKYLKWYQKVAYGSGDMGSNFMYMFVSSFVLIYLTDTMGLNAGIIGTLIMLSKFMDGISDVVFGTLIDRTRSKMGKARPWMFWSAFPLAICEVLLFTIPDLSETLQYVYFFIVYTLLNAVFYTANNISYSSLTALMTKNPTERVQVGSIRYMFAVTTGIVISSTAVGLVNKFGGGVTGWRSVAILFSLLLMLFNTIAVLSVKEVVTEEHKNQNNSSKIGVGKSIKILLDNKYFLLILAYYIVMYTISGATAGIGIYYCTYILENPSILGLFSLVSMLPVILGLAFTPFIVSKWGIYKVNLIGMIIALLFGIPSIFAGYAKIIPLLLILLAIKGLGTSPMIGTLNAVIADVAHYTYNKEGIHMEGTMFSCSSIGIKVGGGVGSALTGWLLSLSGYIGGAEVQSAGALSMIKFLYLVIPIIGLAVQVWIVANLNMEKANKKLLKCQ